MSDAFSPHQLNHVLQQFTELSPWTQFDELTGIVVDLEGNGSRIVCAFFSDWSESDEGGYRLTILRGHDPAYRFLQYRSGEWIPEFGIDFGTTDGLTVEIEDEQVQGYHSHRIGQPPEELRRDEKQDLVQILAAINQVAIAVEDQTIPIFEDAQDICYYVWKVGDHWKVDVREFPDEKFVTVQPIQVSGDRLSRIRAAKLKYEGVWEAAPFYLPVTRIQGDQEMFVQCAAVAERATGLLGLVTLEAHADPEQELVEAILGSIEKQGFLPQFLLVKEERIADRILPIVQPLGIQIRLRRNLRELTRIRDEMIDEFPDEEAEGDQ